MILKGIMNEQNRDLNIDEFGKLADLIYKRIGVRFELNKNYFLSKKLQKRLLAMEIESPSEYLRYLRFYDPTGLEFQQLVNLLTINETYFFRDFSQLEVFAENCLAEILENKLATGDGSLRIWSAGCSTGEEPYTLSIILHEMLEDINQWDVRILASDIDENALKKAAIGEYDFRSLKDVPPEYLKKYFSKGRNGTFNISDKVKSVVDFEHLNLCDIYSVRTRKDFDFILCRNVMIYFDDISRKGLVDHFYIALNKGGYIFLGSSESVNRITSAFKLKRMGKYLVYCKE